VLQLASHEYFFSFELIFPSVCELRSIHLYYNFYSRLLKCHGMLKFFEPKNVDGSEWVPSIVILCKRPI
jgi:hypothetical protein